MQVLKRDYYGFESFPDLERDISEIWYEPAMKNIPAEYQGTMRVTIEYIPSEVENIPET